MVQKIMKCLSQQCSHTTSARTVAVVATYEFNEIINSNIIELIISLKLHYTAIHNFQLFDQPVILFIQNGSSILILLPLQKRQETCSDILASLLLPICLLSGSEQRLSK